MYISAHAYQIYMYNGKCNLDYCFIKPILNKDDLRQPEKNNLMLV